MKGPFAIGVAGMMLAAAPAFAAQSNPPPQITALVQRVASATNHDRGSALQGLYTPDAVVIDENAPYVWRGASAGAAWWRGVDAVVAKAHLRSFGASFKPASEFRLTGNDAYMVQPTTVHGMENGKRFSEPGTMTYTFHRAGGTWKISTQVWTTAP